MEQSKVGESENIKDTRKYKCQSSICQDQVEVLKTQVSSLQQSIESLQAQTERDRKDKERTILEEKGKAEAIRIKMETKKEELEKVILFS